MVFTAKYIDEQPMPHLSSMLAKLQRRKIKGSRAIPDMVIDGIKHAGTTGSISDLVVHSKKDWQRHANKQESRESAEQLDSTVQFMRSIIESQQAELIVLHQSNNKLKDDLSAHGKKTTLLKDIVEDFSAALAHSREEIKDVNRKYQALELENLRLKSKAQLAKVEGAADPLALHFTGPFISEGEMQALAARLTAATEDITRQINEIGELKENITSVSSGARKLARKNEVLARENTQLQQRLASLRVGDCEDLEDDENGSSDDDDDEEEEMDAISNASIKDLTSVVVAKPPVKLELGELRARRLASGGDRSSSYEVIME